MHPETATIPQLNFDGTPFYPEAGTPLEPAKLNFIQHIGDMATKTVIIAQIKAEDVLEVVSNTATAMKDYLKQEGGKIAAHTYLATVAVTGGGLASFLETHTAEAATGPQYTVSSMANGGVYSRNTPHWNDTPRIDGQGIYPGDVLTLECGVVDGDPVGQYNNTTWYYAHDESRNEPDLWVSDHFMDTPNAPSLLAPGVTTCVNEGTDPVDGSINSNGGSQQNNPPTPYSIGNCAMDLGGYIIGTLGNPNDDGVNLNDPNETRDNSDTIVCVHAQVSAADKQSHRIFVSTVEAEAPYVDPAGCPDTNYLLETWGDGFYKNDDCTSPVTWQVNKWVANGTNICAAISDDFEDGTLGEFNKNRQITCVHINA